MQFGRFVDRPFMFHEDQLNKKAFILDVTFAFWSFLGTIYIFCHPIVGVLTWILGMVEYLLVLTLIQLDTSAEPILGGNSYYLFLFGFIFGFGT
mmetsp:Transcript_17009/g.28744  ORF Transcript_17009/g.28744 Transcript_17009/m.28744 type:complete len:94 (+) Transcript_17009:284-565(+)